MKSISELKGILAQHVTWNKARLDCFARMLLALFVARTVNLSEMAVVMASKASTSSRYKRIQRFFSQFPINYDVIAKIVYHWFFVGKSVYLTIDRTNWFWGKTKINVLVLAVAYEGVAIPIFWCVLNKAGNASAKQHCAIIARFIRVFGETNIAGILGDREFASGKLVNFLNKKAIPFYIRIKDGSVYRVNGKKLGKVKSLIKALNPREKNTLTMAIGLYGETVYLAGSRSERGELMVVATNQPPENAIAIYLRRWEIETLFSCLKGRGFRFEETHLVHRQRIKKMLALLTIAFCWAHKTGEWRAEKQPIPWKKHKSGLRPQNSYFRYGLDFIRDILTNPYRKLADFRLLLLMLSPNEPLMEVVA